MGDQSGWLRAVVATLVGILAVAVVVVAALIRPDIPADELEARYAWPDSGFVDVDGLRVHYRDTAGPGPEQPHDAPTLVLLHGSMALSHTWDGWVDELSPEFRIVAIDLPGHGLTGPDPQMRYGPMGMVEVVAAVVDALGVDRFTIGGSSMGGGVAWRYAILHPERMDGLALVGAAGFPREQGGPPLLARVYAVPGVGARAARHTVLRRRACTRNCLWRPRTARRGDDRPLLAPAAPRGQPIRDP